MIEKIYLKLPFFLQNWLINFQGYRVQKRRYGKLFHKELSFYKKSSYNEVDKESLYLFLSKAKNVKFWKERFELYDLKISREKDLLKEIQKLPILTKREVKENQCSINNISQSHKVYWTHTSGTTGSGLVFPQTKIMECKQWAIWWRYRTWHGINVGTWMGWFGGRLIVNTNQKRPPYWRINYPMKQVMFSANHLNEYTVEEYFKQMKKSKLTWLHGYPSQIAFLASLVKDKNLGTLPKLKIITLGAENFLQAQKKIITEVFDVPIRQHYGLAEGVANISEHLDGELRADQDFCYTEFVPVDGENSSLCKIVGTNYSNCAFPLIRYDTGDIANVHIRDNGSKKIVSIDGRNEDYITLPTGVKLGRLDHIFKDFTCIQEAQIYQPNGTEIILHVVKGNKFTMNDELNLLNEARKRLGDELDITIKYFDKIKRTKSGKLKFVISDI